MRNISFKKQNGEPDIDAAITAFMDATDLSEYEVINGLGNLGCKISDAYFFCLIQGRSPTEDEYKDLAENGIRWPGKKCNSSTL